MTKNEKTQTLWHGKVFNFSREEIILPNGKPTVIEAIRHPGSSTTIGIKMAYPLWKMRKNS